MNIWRLIAHHYDAKDAIEQMINTNRLAIGWSKIGSLENFSSQDEVSQAIREHYPDLDNSHTGAPSLYNFFKKVTIGDLVIVNVDRKRHSVFEVIGEYEFTSERNSILGYSHQRKAILVGINAEELWQSSNGIDDGENQRWTLARCSSTKETANVVYREGARHSIKATVIERNAKARQACINHYGGYKCQICAFNFVEMYGELGKDFIHVHHIEGISKKGINDIDPKKDLIPVCPNCHAMLHKKRPPMKPIELKNGIYKRSGKN